MSRTNSWSNATPLSHSKFKNQPGYVRDVKTDIAERLLDILYGFTNSAETEDINGFKMVPMLNWGQASTPTGTGTAASYILFGSHCGSQVELFGIDSGATVTQITSGGSLYDVLSLSSPGQIQTSWNMGTGTESASVFEALSFSSTGTGVAPYISVSTAVCTNLNAAYLDGHSGNSTNLKPFGSWLARDSATSYQAATDGFVTVYTYSENHYITGYTDSNNPPTTEVVGAAAHDNSPSASDFAGGMIMPVKKGDYWKVEGAAESGTRTFTVYWIPLGV